MTEEEDGFRISCEENRFWAKFLSAEFKNLKVKTIKYTKFRTFIVLLNDPYSKDESDETYRLDVFDPYWRYEINNNEKIKGYDDKYDREKYIKITDRMVGQSIIRVGLDKKGRCLLEFEDKSRLVLTPDYENAELPIIGTWWFSKKDRWSFGSHTEKEWEFGFYKDKV